MRKITLLLILIAALSSCSLFKSEKKARSTVIINKDATLKLANKEIEVKGNEGVELPDEAFLVRSAGSMPIFVIPLKSTFEDTKINLSQFEMKELSSVLKQSVSTSLSESLFEVHEIQSEIFQRKYTRALSLIDEAEKKYGSLSFLAYMKSSVYYLTGDKAKAKAILESVNVEEGQAKLKVDSFLRELN